jgi:hypothetical protein
VGVFLILVQHSHCHKDEYRSLGVRALARHVCCHAKNVVCLNASSRFEPSDVPIVTSTSTYVCAGHFGLLDNVTSKVST